MLPCGQDFESAVAEFDDVFSRIPPQVRTSQDEGCFHLHPALNEPRTAGELHFRSLVARPPVLFRPALWRAS
jgi:hypothetical protein